MLINSLLLHVIISLLAGTYGPVMKTKEAELPCVCKTFSVQTNTTLTTARLRAVRRIGLLVSELKVGVFNVLYLTQYGYNNIIILRYLYSAISSDVPMALYSTDKSTNLIHGE